MFHFLFLFSQLWQILIILQTSFNTALWVSTYNWHYDVLLCHYQRQPQFCMQNPNIISVKKTQETEAHQEKCNILIIKGCLQEKKNAKSGIKTLLLSYSPLLKYNVWVLLKYPMSPRLCISWGRSKCWMAVTFSMSVQSTLQRAYNFKSNPDWANV